MNRYIVIFSAVILLCGCTHKEISESRQLCLSFSETQLKTALNTGRTALQWCEGDAISVYNNFDSDIQAATYKSGTSISVPVPVSATSIKATYPQTLGTYSEPGFVFPLEQTQATAGVLNGENYPLVAEAAIEDGTAVLHFSPVGSAFALNVFNPLTQGEKLQKLSVQPSQCQNAVKVSLTEDFVIGSDMPSDKRTYPGQVYACLQKGKYNGIEFKVRTDQIQYTIISNETFMDLENHDFFAVNLDLANMKVYIETVNEDFTIDVVDVTLPSAGFTELVENLPKEQLTEDIIPDFSTVGYHWGEAEFPDYSNTINLPAPSGNDDTKTIQDAIDSAPEGSVIQFDAGCYIVDGLLVIDKNSIILRGSGNMQTEIFARGTVALDDVNPTASGVFYPQIRSIINVGVCDKSSRTAENSHSIAAITVTNLNGRVIEQHPDAWQVHGTGLKSTFKEIMGSGSQIVEDAFCGSDFVTVKNSTIFSVGDNVAVYRPATADWIHDLKMDNIIKSLTDVGTVAQWKTSDYVMYWERTVKAIEGDRIYLDAPLVMSVMKKYGGAELVHLSCQRVKECGIENLKMVSDYNPERNSTSYGVGDVYHASDAIVFYGAEHCWVKNVETHYFSESAVAMTTGSKNITVTDCVQKEPAGYIIGGLRYAFHINGGQKCLVKDCVSDDDRHQFVTAAKVPGPNVFLRCKGTDAHSNIGPHQRWATGTLFDNVSTTAKIVAIDAGNSGTGHGWQGTNQVFWCCTGEAYRLQNPWVTGKNYAIGCKLLGGSPATLTPYNSYPNPGYDPNGNIVYDSVVNGIRQDGECRPLEAGEEESLYESQLQKRLSLGDKVSNYVIL